MGIGVFIDKKHYCWTTLLSTNFNRITMQKVRLPNTDEYVDMQIDLSIFVQDRESEKEIFGWYENIYLSIKK